MAYLYVRDKPFLKAVSKLLEATTFVASKSFLLWHDTTQKFAVVANHFTSETTPHQKKTEKP